MQFWWLDAMEDDAGGGPHAALPAEADGPTVCGPSAKDERSVRLFDEVRALVAMASADGPAGAREQAFVRGLVVVDDALLWRVYRPREAGTPPGPLAARRVLERMVQVALCDRDDGVLDDSERALLGCYARAYDVDDAALERLVCGAGAALRGEDSVRGVLAALTAPFGPRLQRLLRRRTPSPPSRASSTSPSPSPSSLSSPSSSLTAFVVHPREVR
jgi:hypothetical protein